MIEFKPGDKIIRTELSNGCKTKVYEVVEVYSGLWSMAIMRVTYQGKFAGAFFKDNFRLARPEEIILYG